MHFLYSYSFKKTLVFAILFFSFFFLSSRPTQAASLSSASATLTTSRPSPSSPLSANATANVGQLSIFSNGSRYLASDSAKLLRGTGIIGAGNEAIKIASQSGAFTTVYIAGTLTTAGGAGADVLFVPITATHTITFTPNTTISNAGKIIFTYPGTLNTTASPSATTFSFNGLADANAATFIKANNSACSTITVSTSGAPIITCTTGGIIAAGTTVTVSIGCGAAIVGQSCVIGSPLLINPTKAAASGTADIWKIGIQTQSDTLVNLDNSTVAMGTIESVTVRATIDPSLTFNIAGIASGAVNGGNTTGCLQTEQVNSGIATTTTEVGLGVLSIAPAINTKLNNIAAQLLTVTTNGANGYSITATSSGSLKNASTGFFLNSSTTPIAFPASGHFFGLHACGVDTDITKWNSVPSTACNTDVNGSAGTICQYAWPTLVSLMLIAQDTTGPIGNGVPAGNGLVSVSYAATQDVTLPPGEYQTVITYVATPSF